MRRSTLKYKHVQGKNADELDTKVQELLDTGWMLCGSPYIAGNIMLQCMHTPDEVENNDGLTVNDIATLSLLGRVGNRRRF